MVDRKRLELLFSTCKADVIPPILTAHKLFGVKWGIEPSLTVSQTVVQPLH
jgi:hypothetical protein